MDLLINCVITTFIAIALFETFYYWNRVKASYKGIINSIDSVIEDLGLITDEEEEDDELFYQLVDEKFSSYPYKNFSKEPILKEAWDFFKRRISNDKKYALVNSSEFFSREKLINLNTKNRDRIKAIPGLLTAWGLLGTFIAILLGLKGIDPNNIATINNLVHGLYAKFSSSIVALSCSILFVFLERGLYSQVGASCHRLQQILESMFPTISGNEILSNLQNNMEAQAQTITSLSESLSHDSVKSIKQMVKMFKESLTEGTTEQFNDIKMVVNTLCEMLHDIEIEHGKYIEKMDLINDNSERQITKHSQMLDSISQIISNVDSKIDIFQKTIESVKETNVNLLNSAGEISVAVDRVEDSMPAIAEHKESIKQLTENLNKSVDYFNRVTNEISGAKLDEIINNFKEGIKVSLQEIQVGLNNDLDIIKEGNKLQNAQLDKFVEASSENIDKIHSSMNDYTEKTCDFIAQYDDSIAKAVNVLKTNVDAMGTSLKDNIKSLENNFADLNKTLESINENMKNEV